MAPGTPERRSIVVAGVGVFGALLVLVVMAIVASGGAGDPAPTTPSTVTCAPDDDACRAAAREGDRQGIIPRPGEGRAPTEPGDRGGWEQIALLGVILAAVALIATMVVRSTRRSRRGPTRADPGDGTAFPPAP